MAVYQCMPVHQYISVCSPVCLWQPGIYCLAHFHLPLLSSAPSHPIPIYFPYIVHILLIILPTFSPCVAKYCHTFLSPCPSPFSISHILSIYCTHIAHYIIVARTGVHDRIAYSCKWIFCRDATTCPTKYLFIDCRVKHFLAGA